MYVRLVSDGTLVYDNIMYIFLYYVHTGIPTFAHCILLYILVFYSVAEKIKLVKQNDFVLQKCR